MSDSISNTQGQNSRKEQLFFMEKPLKNSTVDKFNDMGTKNYDDDYYCTDNKTI